MSWSTYGLPISSGPWCAQQLSNWQPFYDLLEAVRLVELDYVTSCTWHNSGVGSELTISGFRCISGGRYGLGIPRQLIDRACSFLRRMVDYDYVADGNALDEDFSELLLDETPSKFYDWVRDELDTLGEPHTLIDAIEDDKENGGPDYEAAFVGCLDSTIVNTIWALCEVLRTKWAVLWSSDSYSTRNDFDHPTTWREMWEGESLFSSNPCDTVRQQAATDFDGNTWGTAIYQRPLTEARYAPGDPGEHSWWTEWQRVKYELDDMGNFPGSAEFQSFEYAFNTLIGGVYVNLSGDHGEREISLVKSETVSGSVWESGWANDNPSSINPLNHGAPVQCGSDESERWGYFSGFNLVMKNEFDEPA